MSAPLRCSLSWRNSVTSVTDMQWLLQSRRRSAPTPNQTTHPSTSLSTVTAFDVNQAIPQRPGSHTVRRLRAEPPPPGVQRLRRTEDPCPNKPWFAVTATRGPLHLVPGGAAPELPYALAHLGDGLRRDRLAEAGEAAGGVDRDPAAQGGGAVTEQLLRLALAAQADVLVPVELQGRREVVDLGQADVLGADAGLGVGCRGDGGAEADGGRLGAPAAWTRRESVEKFGISITVLGNVGVTVDTASMVTSGVAPPAWRRANSMLESTSAAPPSEVAQISSRRSGSATMGDARTSSTVTSFR